MVVVPRCYQPTTVQREIYVTLRLCILSIEARVGGGCPAMLSAYHNTKRMYNEKEAHDTEDMLMATKLLTKR